MLVLLDRTTNRIRRFYTGTAYAGEPTYRTVVEHRQVLPNAEGVFRPKAPDVGAAAKLASLIRRGRRA